MGALEEFINIDDTSDLDPLIKMAIIRHQVESIHPFPNGNGRVGRILNVLYLSRCGLPDIPSLYPRRHIVRTGAGFYRLLQSVRDEGTWGAWPLYMLAADADFVTKHGAGWSNYYVNGPLVDLFIRVSR